MDMLPAHTVCRYQLMQVPRHFGIACWFAITLWTLLPVVAIPVRADMDSHVASGSRAGYALVGHQPFCSAAQGVCNAVAALLS